MNRRTFIKYTAKSAVFMAAGAAGLGARPVRADQANDRIVVALIGAGSRGRDLGRIFCHQDNVVMKYVCDPDLDRIGNYPGQLERIQPTPVEAVQDLRKVLDDPEVDAVCVATCDHWHGLATVWACQAGKDVYVEKPASHNVWEGRKMVEATERYGRIVQVGTQNRSAPYVRAAQEYIAAGNLGEIPLVKVFNLKPGMPFRMPRDSDLPERLDYDLYLGPAPSRPFNQGHFHGTWKHWWAYSGGDMADDGVHQIDIARLLIGDPGAPETVLATGGKLAYPDSDGDVPDTQVVTYRYPETVMTFELTNYAPYMRKTTDEERNTDLFPDWSTNATRIELYGKRQKMILGRHGGGWQAVTAGGEVVAEEYGRQHTVEHIQDFVACVRSRKKPNADIEQGHESAVLVHLGNIATEKGGLVRYDPASETIVDDSAANDFLLRKREYREGFRIEDTV